MKVRSGILIRYALEPVDFRKSIDGLAMAVGQTLGRDPMGGEIFIFRNKRKTAPKALYWTPNGFVMLYKRLEKGRFTPPRVSKSTGDLVMETGAFQDLLDGLTSSIETRDCGGKSS